MSTQVYEIGGLGVAKVANLPIFSPRDPVDNIDVVSPNGNPYDIMQAWKNTLTGSVFQFTGNGNWMLSSSNSGPVSTLTGDTGGAIAPIAGNINIVGGDTVSVVGSGNTLTIDATKNGFPITPYVVGPAGQAGYQTIAAALFDIVNAGSGTIYIQDGTYNESLLFTVVPHVQLVGLGNVIINGTHFCGNFTDVTCTNISFTSSGSIFSSNLSVGSSVMTCVNCNFACNGYIYDLPKWIPGGHFFLIDCTDVGAVSNAIINNAFGASIDILGCQFFSGGPSFDCIGATKLWNTVFALPVTFTGNTADCFQNNFELGISSNAGSDVTITECIVRTPVTGPAIATATPSGTFVTNSTIDSPTSPAISGNGTISLENVIFPTNSDLDPLLTISYPTSELGRIFVKNLSFDRGATFITTNGQLIVGKTGSDPVITTLTAGTGISITNGSGSITVAATNGGFSWNEITTTSNNMASGNGYIANNAGLVTLTLPAVAAIGSTVQVTGKGAGGWRIAQNAGQTIYFNAATTTTGVGGSLSSTSVRDGVELVCVTANNDWNVLDSIGTLAVV